MAGHRRGGWRDREGRIDDYRLRAQQELPLFEGEEQQKRRGRNQELPLLPEPPAEAPGRPLPPAARASAEKAGEVMAQAREALRSLPELGEVLISPKQLTAYLGVCRRTLWLMLATGRLPEPIRFGARLVRWRPEDIRAWLSALPREARNPYREGR